VYEVAALPAIAFGKLQPEEAELAAAAKEIAGELARLLPFVDVRSDLGGDEAPDALAKLLVLLSEWRQLGPNTGVLDDRHSPSSVV